jgi:hypothetical protein
MNNTILIRHWNPSSLQDIDYDNLLNIIIAHWPSIIGKSGTKSEVVWYLYSALV